MGGDAPVGRVVVSAPGKVILHGEHAVVFGRAALAASLGLRTTLTLEEEASDAPVVRVQFPAVELERSLPLPSAARPFAGGARSWAAPAAADHHGLLGAVDGFVAAFAPGAETMSAVQKNAVRGFLYLLTGILGDEPSRRTLSVRVESALPVGAGCGSSAALAVCAAAALLHLRRARAESGGAALHRDDRELTSAWAFNCERIMHGTPSGVDNATCTHGGLVSFRKGSAPRPLRPRAQLRVLLVDTRVGRQTSAQAARVAALRGRLASAVDCVLDACGHVTDAAAQILEQLSDEDPDADRQYERLAELWDVNHCLLAALGVSHPALEDVRRRAARRGLAAKLTGAGGGGCAVVLLPPGAAAAGAALAAELREAGCGVWDARLGGDGVALHA